MSALPDRLRKAIGSGEAVVQTHEASDTRLAFARSVAAGLRAEPKWLHCRFLYDAEGSELFEQITEQPEYYPTRTEAAILANYAAAIREHTGPVTLVELGSGYSVKTEHLLFAYSADGAEVHYVPVDVSVSALEAARESISENFAEVKFTGIAGTYGSAFPIFGELSPQMVVFLGSTLGNFNPAEATAFWRSVSGHLPAGDYFLLGVDLVKDAEVVEAAYNDAAGITARFTINYFTRMNQELGSNVDVSQVEHAATWNPELEQIETRARFKTPQSIYVEPLDETFDVDAGEEILIEISRKFRLPQLSEELSHYGFDVVETFTDEKEWFALLLLQRIDDAVLRRAPQPSERR